MSERSDAPPATHAGAHVSRSAPQPSRESTAGRETPAGPEVPDSAPHSVVAQKHGNTRLLTFAVLDAWGTEHGNDLAADLAAAVNGAGSLYACLETLTAYAAHELANLLELDNPFAADIDPVRLHVMFPTVVTPQTAGRVLALVGAELTGRDPVAVVNASLVGMVRGDLISGVIIALLDMCTALRDGNATANLELERKDNTHA